MDMSLEDPGVEAEKNELRLLFKAIDVDNSGHISKEEFKEALHTSKKVQKFVNSSQILRVLVSRNDFDQAFMKMDTDNSNEVTFEEFWQFCEEESDKRNIKELFKAIDKDGSKKITVEEFKWAFDNDSRVRDFVKRSHILAPLIHHREDGSEDFDQAFGRYITTKTSDESAAIPTFTTSLVNDYNQTYFEHELTRLIQADAPRYMVYSSVISDQYTYLDTSGCNFLTIVTNATLSSTNEYTAMLRIPSDDLLVGMSVTADTGLASGTTLASFDPANNLTLTFDKAHVQVGNVTLTLTLPCNPPNVTVITTSASLTVESDVPYYVTIQPYNAMGTSEEINHRLVSNTLRRRRDFGLEPSTTGF